MMFSTSLPCHGRSFEDEEAAKQLHGRSMSQSPSGSCVTLFLEPSTMHSPAVWVSVLFKLTKPGRFSSSSFSLCSSLLTESIVSLHSPRSFICSDIKTACYHSSHKGKSFGGKHLFNPCKGSSCVLLPCATPWKVSLVQNHVVSTGNLFTYTKSKTLKMYFAYEVGLRSPQHFF